MRPPANLTTRAARQTWAADSALAGGRPPTPVGPASLGPRASVRANGSRPLLAHPGTEVTMPRTFGARGTGLKRAKHRVVRHQFSRVYEPPRGHQYRTRTTIA